MSFTRQHTGQWLLAIGLLCVVWAGGVVRGTAQAWSPSLQSASTNYANLPYPHVMLYAGVNSNGWPLVGSIAPTGQCSNNSAIACEFNSDCLGYSCDNTTNRTPNLVAPLNQAEIAQYAKFSMITLPPTPVVDQRLDIIPALRAENPNIKVFAYVMPTTSWCPNGGYPSGVYYGDVREIPASIDNSNAPFRSSCLTNGPGFLHMQRGGIASDPGYGITENINLAYRVLQPDQSYTYPVADAMAELVFSKVYQSHLFDGIFHDVFSSQVLWMEHADSDPSPADNSAYFDYIANGYGDTNDDPHDPGNRAAFGAGWTAGFEEYGKHLRSLITAAGDPDFPITGNGGLSDRVLHTTFNGWMRENFPHQAGGSWYTNMYDPTVGYLIDNQSFRGPQINMLFGASDPWWDPYTTANTRGARFTLGSASLGEGYGIFQEASVSVYASPAQHLWYDEYGVNTTGPQTSVQYGQSGDTRYQGWLGQPTSDAYQMIWANTNPDLVTSDGFESGTSGWQWAAYSPAAGTMVRELSGAAQGSADVHLHLTSLGVANYSASFSSANTFSLTAGTEYSVTFWAKADHARAIDVVFDKPAAGGYANQVQPLTTTWKRYQVRLVPNATVSGANIRFDIGGETGDVWLDDVHVQLGLTSAYRRDFDHGIVLVNPSLYNTTVTLERPFKKIRGVQDPTINSGAVVSSATLIGSQFNNGVGDALFLLNYDATPPAQVTNLQGS